MPIETETLPAFDPSIYSELDELAELEADWDQQGGYAIDPAKVASAKRLLQFLDGKVTPPHVAPTSSGSVDFEWSRKSGKERLIFHFVAADSIRYLKWSPQQGIKEPGSVATSDKAMLLELTSWFMNGSQAL